MTDKQIIVDGVYVTQCPYYKEDKTCTYLPYKSKCEGDCNWTSYKEMEEQLQAKEQECEELKKQRTAYIKEAEENFEVYTKLKDNYKKLSQTLTEIKEIARVNSINTCWTAINLCADCDEIKECGLQSPFEKLKAIIQKISEVEDE